MCNLIRAFHIPSCVWTGTMKVAWKQLFIKASGGSKLKQLQVLVLSRLVCLKLENLTMVYKIVILASNESLYFTLNEI